MIDNHGIVYEFYLIVDLTTFCKCWQKCDHTKWLMFVCTTAL